MLLSFFTFHSIALANVTESIQDVPQTLSAGEVHLPPANTENVLASEENPYPYVKTFIISAYYSPLPGQIKYVTGSLDGDIRLNGSGVNSADGTPVYPGMIAAPKTYQFGTKMNIPGIGTVAVHDRGGAIVTSGERGNSYDRLDVWMGYGDPGLTRALNWGKRTVDVTIYGMDSSIAENIYLEGYSESERNYIANTLTESNQPTNYTTPTSSAVSIAPASIAISSSLTIGSEGEEVKRLQEWLKELNYYNGEVNGVYDMPTVSAVYDFQVSENIVGSQYDYGAGYFGPKTSKILALKITTNEAHAQVDTFEPVNVFNRDLKFGDSGDDVRQLQEELKNINLFGIETSGYYGELTEHAVFKFQQINKLAGTKDSLGAGIFGPMTRTAFNQLLAERQRIESMVINRKEED